MKKDEANFKAQAEAQKIEIEDLRRQLAEAKKNKKHVKVKMLMLRK